MMCFLSSVGRLLRLAGGEELSCHAVVCGNVDDDAGSWDGLRVAWQRNRSIVALSFADSMSALYDWHTLAPESASPSIHIHTDLRIVSSLARTRSGHRSCSH